MQSTKLKEEERPIPANADASTVAGFGDEWSRFDQSAMSAEEHAELFDKYFHLVDWNALPARRGPSISAVAAAAGRAASHRKSARCT